ncbi:MAG: FxLYD domain-containing protein [Bryobacteraceae bacterium]
MAATRRLVLLLAPALMLAAAGEQARRPSPTRIEMVEVKIRRVPEDGTVSVEGRLRNSGERPIRGLHVVFRVLAPGGEEVARQRGNVEEDPFESGQEYEFHWQMKDPVRGVEVRVVARDTAGHEVEVQKAGPYTIE